MNQKRILYIGNPCLREISKEVSVEEIKSSEFQLFIDDLVEIMREHNGVGIAASQTGVNKRVFVIEVDDNKRYPDKENFSLTTCVNPVITVAGDEIITGWEGCLSVPFYKGLVPRHKKISIKYLNRDAVEETRILEGFHAIIAQHENDHLNGVLFTDRISDMKSLTYLEKSPQI